MKHLILLTLALASFASAADKPTHLFILSGQSRKIVREAQVEIAKSDAHGAWVDCDDLNDKEVEGVMTNDLHYTNPGYELLGRRFMRQAKALIEGKTPAANGRPE
jgi:hypothetical protein